MMEPFLLADEHPPRALLGPEEHGVEIGAHDVVPFLGGDIGGAGGMGDTGVVDEDSHGPERLLGLIEGAGHLGAVEHVGRDGDGLAAALFELPDGGLQLVGTARHQRHRCAVGRQHLGEAQAQAPGRAGHQRNAAFEVEQFGGFHAHLPP